MDKSNLDRNYEGLKLLALALMLLDHAAILVVENQTCIYVLRTLGRACWPLIAYLMAVRLAQNPQRVKGYIRRLLPWAVLSQIPYAFGFLLPYGFSPLQTINIMATLALGALVVSVVEKAKSQPWAYAAVPMVLGLAVFVDYGVFGVASIPLLTYLLQTRPRTTLWVAPLLGSLTAGFTAYQQGAESLAMAIFILGPLLSLPLLALAQKGALPGPRLPRQLFYFFYPAHLALLLGIAAFLR